MSPRPINPVLKQALELGPTILFFVIYLRLKERSFDIGGTTYSGFIVATLVLVPLLALGGWLPRLLDDPARLLTGTDPRLDDTLNTPWWIFWPAAALLWLAAGVGLWRRGQDRTASAVASPALVALAASPAVLTRVVTDTRAAGPVTDRAIVLATLSTLYALTLGSAQAELINRPATGFTDTI